MIYKTQHKKIKIEKLKTGGVNLFSSWISLKYCSPGVKQQSNNQSYYNININSCFIGHN